MKIQINDTLSLQLLELSDAHDIFPIIDSQREYLGEWLPFVPLTKGVEDIEEFIQSMIESAQNKTDFALSIKKNQQLIGLVHLKDIDKLNLSSEIGYWISKDYRGQGIVTSCVSKLCDFAFEELQLNRILIKCAVGNIASRSIPKKLGFTFEGIELSLIHI